MNYYGLSNPTDIKNPKNCYLDLIEDYKNASNDFFNRDTRPKLKGIFIYIDSNIVEGINERYLHTVSIKENEYHMNPCLNEESSIHCVTKCEIENSPKCFQSINRSFCYYRMRRSKWISEIIKLANEDNEHIKMWTKSYKDKTNGRKRFKRFVWYKNGLASYLIIFEEKYKDGKLNILDFRTAYPVFLRHAEKDLEKDYLKYKNR